MAYTLNKYKKLKLFSLFAFFILFLDIKDSLSQVTVGYRNPIISSASAGREIGEITMLTNQFVVFGENVVPSDGTLEFDRKTEWVVRDPTQGFSLIVEDMNPMIEVTSSAAKSRMNSASRKELLPIVVSGPAANALRSVFPITQRLNPNELDLFKTSSVFQ